VGGKGKTSPYSWMLNNKCRRNYEVIKLESDIW
jgi:hypothetical protein